MAARMCFLFRISYSYWRAWPGEFLYLPPIRAGLIKGDICSGASTSLPHLVVARVFAGLSGSGMVSLVSIIIMGTSYS